GYLCVFRDVMVLRKMMSDLAVSRDKLAEIIEQLQQEIEKGSQAAKALRESEAQKQAILDASVDMIMQVDTGMRIIWANKKAAAVVNKTPEDLIGHTCHKFFQNADSPCPGCPCKKALETGNIEHGIMYQPAMNAVGESYWEDFGVPVKDESDKVVGVIEIARDVTEKIKAEQALTRAKKDWEHTFDAITDIVMVLDKEHRILRANRATVHRLHMAEESLLGKKCYEVIHGERHPIDGCPLSYTAKTLEPQTAEVTVPNLRKIFICSTSPVWDDERNLTGYTHTLRDVTERKRLEAKFQQAQKLKAIGTLAGGIAHNFNNLLMGILGHVSLMSLEADIPNAIQKRLNDIQKLVISGSKLTSQLLGYAREGKYEVKTVSLNQLVKQSCDTFGMTHKQIGVHLELADNLFFVEADPSQLEQVLLNLLINAADAIPDNGDIMLKTMNTTHEDMESNVYDPKPGKYVLLTVTDTGMGMDKKIMEHIFEPFFTTKEMGINRGIGLGLASVYGIIKGHDGYIDVASEKGHGTTFKIYLPASENEAQELTKTADEIFEGTGTVLLVDDEESVLEVGRELLEVIGYQVLVARDGKEAIEVYGKNRDKVDIVILDLVMPTMGGGKAYDRMKEINPDIKVLLSSGFSVERGASEILKRGCNGFIQKPFNVKELSGKIREILDKK
ncbi:MAG: PAS domain-containing protein, partial [Desulfobacterales bacterium]